MPDYVDDIVATRFYGVGIRFATSTTSAQSAAISAREVLLHAVDARVHWRTGTNPTAVVDADTPLEAGEKFHIRIQPGHKVAAITASGSGYLYITPVA